jgi:hypothetical protein
MKNVEQMNLKAEFSKWFAPKAPKSYKTWFGKNLDGKLDDINSAYKTSFKKSLFDIDRKHISKEIAGIKNNIAGRHNANDKTFAKYDEKTSNGIPKAIINCYYIRFLESYNEETGGKNDDNDGDKTGTLLTYEKDLQNTLISQAEQLFQGYKIYGENGEGIEYGINGKRMDLLLENEDKNKLLVIELKAGPADYKVCGQIQMYMGPLMQKYPDREIRGVIIAGEIDDSLKMAILANEKIKGMTYSMNLTLEETGN